MYYQHVQKPVMHFDGMFRLGLDASETPRLPLIRRKKNEINTHYIRWIDYSRN